MSEEGAVMALEQKTPATRHPTRSGEGRVIAVKLATPESVQKLRTALDERAKRDKELCFYSLYDKVYRQDVLAYAYALCRANKGAACPDGVTFERLPARAERTPGPRGNPREHRRRDDGDCRR